MDQSSSSKPKRKAEAMNEWDALELERIAKVKEMYSKGVPFFTKDSIRNIQQQLLKAKTGDEISVLNLDGTSSKFKISNGEVVDGDEPKTEMVQIDPHIGYESIQSLTRRIDGVWTANFCPMPITHFLEVRDKVTKEFCQGSKKDPNLPREEAEEFFKTCCKEWEASEPCKQLRSILASAKLPLGITKIVAFACSNFSRIITQKRHSSRGLVRPATQHALILTLRDILSKRDGGSSGEIECYAQDPVYSSLDKSILEQSGIKILSDPEGFLEVDESTVVLSFCPNVCVRQVVTDIARPAMMIWDRVRWNEDEMDGEPCTDPDSPRLKKMVQASYEESEMPDDYDDVKKSFGSKFGNAGIYIRKANALSRL